MNVSTNTSLRKGTRDTALGASTCAVKAASDSNRDTALAASLLSVMSRQRAMVTEIPLLQRLLSAVKAASDSNRDTALATPPRCCQGSDSDRNAYIMSCSHLSSHHLSPHPISNHQRTYASSSYASLLHSYVIINAK